MIIKEQCNISRPLLDKHFMFSMWYINYTLIRFNIVFINTCYVRIFDFNIKLLQLAFVIIGRDIVYAK